MIRTTALGAWVELMRLSNAPTVASNVLAGLAVGMLSRPAWAGVPWSTASLLIAGALLIYAAGMVLNDAFDARIDARERPGRPIPSGRVSVQRARFVGLAMLGAGMGALFAAGIPTVEEGALRGFSSRGTIPWALLLGASVLAYDALHLRTRAAVPLVAVCRACVVVVAAFAVVPDPNWAILRWTAGGVLVFVLALTIAARDEVRGLGTAAWRLAAILPLLALAPLGNWVVEGVTPDSPELWFGVAGTLLVAMAGAAAGTRAARAGAVGVPRAVGAWIGAIPAIDAATCYLLGRPALGTACIGLWALAALLRPRIAAS
ncbi:MAG: UbiA family prenyltransferase [Phycisphaerales bacterium]